MSSTIGSILPDERSAAAWLCLCPLLALATTWQIALTLAVCLLIVSAVATAALILLHRALPNTLRLPPAALISGTIVVLCQLALAAWWPMWDSAIASRLLLVAGLAVLVCCAPDDALRNNTRGRAADFNIVHTIKLGAMLSVALFVIGVARDLFGRVFLLADTPIDALVLLALLLALLNTMTSAPSPQPSPPSLLMGEREHVS